MPIRELILLRHAHAESAEPGQDDLARVLSVSGDGEADATGQWLKQHGAAPERVLCSPAARARDTCERVLSILGYADLRTDSRIYEATPGALIRVLDEHQDARSILLVGHNPGLENLAALLSEGASDSGRGMPPGAAVWLDLADGGFEPGSAKIRHFWWP